MSRYRTEQMNMPQSGPSGYYFPWDSRSRTFDTSSFDPAFSGNRISQQDIQAFFADLYAQPLFDPKDSNCLCYVVLGLFGLMVLAQAIFLATSFKRLNKTFFVIPIIFGVFIVLVCLAFCKAQNDAVRAVFERKAQVDAVFARHMHTNPRMGFCSDAATTESLSYRMHYQYRMEHHHCRWLRQRWDLRNWKPRNRSDIPL